MLGLQVQTTAHWRAAHGQRRAEEGSPPPPGGGVCYRVATCHPGGHPDADGRPLWTLRPTVLAARGEAEALGRAIMRRGPAAAVILEQRDGLVWHPAWLRLREATGDRRQATEREGGG